MENIDNIENNETIVKEIDIESVKKTFNYMFDYFAIDKKKKDFEKFVQKQESKETKITTTEVEHTINKVFGIKGNVLKCDVKGDKIVSIQKSPIKSIIKAIVVDKLECEDDYPHLKKMADEYRVQYEIYMEKKEQYNKDVKENASLNVKFNEIVKILENKYGAPNLGTTISNIVKNAIDNKENAHDVYSDIINYVKFISQKLEKEKTEKAIEKKKQKSEEKKKVEKVEKKETPPKEEKKEEKPKRQPKKKEDKKVEPEKKEEVPPSIMDNVPEPEKGLVDVGEVKKATKRIIKKKN